MEGPFSSGGFPGKRGLRVAPSSRRLVGAVIKQVNKGKKEEYRNERIQE
jgi:hypothetical protein